MPWSLGMSWHLVFLSLLDDPKPQLPPFLAIVELPSHWSAAAGLGLIVLWDSPSEGHPGWLCFLPGHGWSFAGVCFAGFGSGIWAQGFHARSGTRRSLLQHVTNYCSRFGSTELRWITGTAVTPNRDNQHAVLVIRSIPWITRVKDSRSLLWTGMAWTCVSHITGKYFHHSSNPEAVQKSPVNQDVSMES